MKFKPIIISETAGSSLVGILDVSYHDLERVFGPPHVDGSWDGKTKAEWDVKFEDGTVAAIYDYRSPDDPVENREWHVGGFSVEAVCRVTDLLSEYEILYETLR